MARYDKALRQGAASRSLAEAKAKKEEEDDVGWDVLEGLAGITDIGLMIAQLPPLASTGVQAIKGVSEGDAGSTVDALGRGTQAYMTHEAGKKKTAREKEALGLRREEVEATRSLASALRSRGRVSKDDEEEED